TTEIVSRTAERTAELSAHARPRYQGEHMDTEHNRVSLARPRTVAIFARTAAVSQSGVELQQQIDACVTEAAARGWAANEDLVFTDEDVGGLTTIREGLQSMLALIQRQPELCTVVVVSDAAR